MNILLVPARYQSKKGGENRHFENKMPTPKTESGPSQQRSYYAW